MRLGCIPNNLRHYSGKESDFGLTADRPALAVHRSKWKLNTMIYDTLENFGKYLHTGSPLFGALAFAVEFDPSKPDGRYEIESEKIYALVSSYETSPASQNRFEIHRKYADVQIVIEGEETVEVSLSSEPKSMIEYCYAMDKIFLESPGDSASLVMRRGYFTVIYPNEAHRPNCDVHGKQHVRKIVVKIRMNLEERY
jgi:YhcH/YjgK/YiaL family protein